MNRYRFRAWHEATKRMLGPTCIMDIYFRSDRKHPYGVHYETPGYACKVEELYDIILMQSTGFTDRNGVEIFEGDILRDDTGVGEVKWLPEHCALMVRAINPHKYHHFDSDGQLKNSEVIGNIYQHPELLEAL